MNHRGAITLVIVAFALLVGILVYQLVADAFHLIP